MLEQSNNQAQIFNNEQNDSLVFLLELHQNFQIDLAHWFALEGAYVHQQKLLKIIFQKVDRELFVFMDVVVRKQFLHCSEAYFNYLDVACSHEEYKEDQEVARNNSAISLLIDED